VSGWLDVNTFQVHIVKLELRRGKWELFDDDRFLPLNRMAVDLRRVDGDYLLYPLLVLFHDLNGAVGSGFHLHTIDLCGYGLNLWRRRLFNGWWGLLIFPIEVVFVLQMNSVPGQISKAV